MSIQTGHILAIRKDPSPLDPKSEQGKIWYAALRFLANQDGWSETLWGFVEQAQHMYLINGELFSLRSLNPSLLETWCAEIDTTRPLGYSFT